MLTYEGKSAPIRACDRSHTKSGKHSFKKKTCFSDKLYIKTVVCGALIIAIILVKLIIPGTAEKLKDYTFRAVMGNIDYKSAIAVFGQVINGEKRLSSAVREAYSYAFSLSGEKIETSAINELKSKNKIEASVEAIEHIIPANTPKMEIENTEKAEDKTETAKETIDSTDNINGEDVVSAFIESQSEYNDIDLPANVTYDMPVLDIDGICPVLGVVSSGFGYREHPSDGQVRFHYGTDIAADKGEMVSAFSDGTVYAVGESSGYGQYIMLEHECGVQTMYAHLDEILVAGGEEITKGMNIGKVGDTGNATGPCLHFEIITDGTYVNPEYYVSW